jgi:alpha-mannosidase
MGRHEFVYGLMPHDGDWRAAGVDREGERMIRGEWSVALEPGRAGTIKGAWAPLTVEAGGGAAVRVAAIKRAEEGGRLIVRLVESHGIAGACEIEWNLEVEGVEAVDLLERPMALPGFAHTAGRTRFPLRPFQIVTLAVRVG